MPDFRTIARKAVPPALLDLRHFLAAQRRQPQQWHQIRDGVLEGQWLFVTLSDKWAKEMLNGTYEPLIVAAVVSRVKQGWVCYDVGAHVGYYTLLLAKLAGLNGDIYAFEPLPFNLDCLNLHVDRNHVAGSIHVHPVAISDAAGVGILQGIQSLRKSSKAFLEGVRVLSSSSSESTVGHRVEKRRIDDLVAIHRLPAPHFVKLDVEGAELDVLHGARETIRNAKPVILAELHTAATTGECVALLKDDRYEVRVLNAAEDDRCHIIAEPR